MAKKVLLTATVQSHICQFHKPLAKILKEYGYTVHVAARDNLAEKNGLKMEYIDKIFDVPFDRSPLSPNNINAYQELAKILSDNSYDIIHTNTPMGGLITRLAAKQYRKKGTCVIYTAHGFHFYEGAPKKNWLLYYPVEKFLSKYTDKLITITKEDYNLAKDKFKCPVYYIHGVGANSARYNLETEEIRAKYRKEFGFKEEDKIVLNVGELLPNKNQKTAILAIKKVVESIPNALLLIAGNGPEKEKLEEIIAENGLTDKVIMLGYTMELPKYMACADALISCSYREGLPLNVMEAMMSGKPVVVSDNRGHRELVENGKNGYIVEPDDVNGYFQKLIEVLTNSNKYSHNAVIMAEPFKDFNVAQELKNIYGLV